MVCSYLDLVLTVLWQAGEGFCLVLVVLYYGVYMKLICIPSNRIIANSLHSALVGHAIDIR